MKEKLINCNEVSLIFTSLKIKKFNNKISKNNHEVDGILINRERYHRRLHIHHQNQQVLYVNLIKNSIYGLREKLITFSTKLLSTKI